MTRIAFLLVIAFLALALVAAGCGGGDEEAAETTTEETTTEETTTEETTTEETTAEPSGEGTTLRGTVGPGFDISLSTGADALAPGAYTLEVEDLASAHNFHLTGPGVDVMTSVADEGSETFRVELQPGTYTFVCDPHAFSMRGSFEVSG